MNKNLQQYEIIEAFGITVVPVPDLRDNAVLIEDYGVALVRAELSPEESDEAVDWLLAQALADDTGQREG